MSDYAQITKSLRMYPYDAMIEIPSCLKRAFSFCDGIDAKYKALENEYAEMREFVDCVKEEVEARNDVTLWGTDYTALPLDADGVPIHVGDMMHGTCPSGKYVCGEVSAIGDNKFWLSNVQFSLRPSFMHHYHKPTVEDVLRELWDESHDDFVSDRPFDSDAIIKRFAKRLKLADGDDDE